MAIIIEISSSNGTMTLSAVELVPVDGMEEATMEAKRMGYLDVVEKVEGGFMAFENHDEHNTWLNQN